jgi:hypothetical protein
LDPPPGPLLGARNSTIVRLMSALPPKAAAERTSVDVAEVPEAVIPSLINTSVMSDKTRHFFTIKIGQQDVSRRVGELGVHFISRPANM